MDYKRRVIEINLHKILLVPIFLSMRTEEAEGAGGAISSPLIDGSFCVYSMQNYARNQQVALE